MRVSKRLLREDHGQGLIEYALILLLIAIVCIASLNLLGHKSSNSLSNSVNTLNSVM